ncbi:hypothetical protein FRC05_000693 [Tulasnella sp. 425]|nr:hypothetical protein FRC05_000693 [Tulasnella sp. 425]
MSGCSPENRTSLGNIGGDYQHLRDAVFEAGGCRLFLEVLDNPEHFTDAIVGPAAQALACCTRPNAGGPFSDEVTRQMIRVLTKFIKRQTNRLSKSLDDVVMALGRIISTDTAVDTAVETGITPQLVQLSAASSWTIQYNAIRCFARFASQSRAGMETVIECGGLKSFGLAISSTHFEIRGVGCWVIDSILHSTPAHVKSLIKSSVVPALARVVSNEEELPDTRGEANLALSTLAGKARGDEELDLLVKAGIVEAFCSVLQPSDYRNSLLALQGIIALLEQEWVGQKEALARLKAAGGATRLRAVRDGASDQDHWQAIRHMAQGILKAHIPESSQQTRV